MDKGFQYNPVPKAAIWMIASIICALFMTKGTLAEHNVLVVLNMFAYYLCFRNWVQSGARITSLYVFFVAYTLFSNLGQPILHLFFVPEELLTIYNRASIPQISDMLRFQLLCISGLNLGTVLYLGKPNRAVSIAELRESYESTPKGHHKYEALFDILLFASLGYYLVVCGRMFIMRQTMDYMEFFELGRGMDEGLLVNFAKFFSVVLSFWALFNKRHLKVIYIAIIIIVIVTNLTGARGLSVSFVAILLTTLPVTHSRWFTKKTILLWIAGAFVFFSLLSVISTNRQATLDGNVLASEYGLGYSAMATMSEMGRSATPVIYTMTAVDKGEPMHQSILVAFTRSLVPLSSRLPFVKDEIINLSDWVTDYAAISTSGLGFSCIAELYMNFRWLGWIFLILHGYFLAYAENKAYRNIIDGKYAYAVCLLSYCAVLVPWARGEFGRMIAFLRYGIYVMIIQYFYQNKS